MDFNTDDRLIKHLLAGEKFLYVDAAGKIVPKGHKAIAEIFWVRDQGKAVKIFGQGGPIDSAIEDMIRVLRERWEADKAAHEAAMAAAAPAEAAVNETLAGMQVVPPSRPPPRPSPPASAQPMPMPIVVPANDQPSESSELPRRDDCDHGHGDIPMHPVATPLPRETESISSLADVPTCSASPTEVTKPTLCAPVEEAPPAATVTPPAASSLPVEASPIEDVPLFELESSWPLPPPNKGGRPRLHAWDEVIMAFAIYYFRSLPTYPPSENQCRSYIRKWFEETSKHVPVESEIAGLVKRFLPVLRQARQDVKDKFLAQNLKS